MAIEQHTYTISTDFTSSSGKVALRKLIDEIHADAAILTDLDNGDHAVVDYAADKVDLWFKNALTTGTGSEKEALDAIVTSHDGVPKPRVGERTDGVSRVQVTPGAVGKKLSIKGKKFTATLDSTTDDDTSFGEERELQGICLEVSDHTPGDYVEFTVVQSGTPDVVLGQYGETVYIPPSGKIDPIIAEGTATIPSGIKMRLAYTSVATSGTAPECYLWYRTRK